jgi:DNA-binding MarR family transcriptional regulator
VTGLEREGLVRRRSAARDARLTLIHATNRGRKVLLAGRDRRVRTLQSALEKLNATELAKLASLSHLLTDLVVMMKTTADKP